MAVLAAATLAAHAVSLHDGLWFDDHLHRQRLDAYGWSIRELLETTTIAPEAFMDHWWQERSIRWQYARPFSVLLMKVTHLLSGGSAVAQHAVNLALHLTAAGLVYQLCLLLTRRRFWSLVGGLVFVVYPASVYTVGWLATQNVLLGTVLMLGALLCYRRASGLELSPSVSWAGARGTTSAARTRPPALKRWPLACAMLFWCLAVLSRESALVLPIVLAAFDLAFGGARHAWARRRVYLLMGAAGATFLCWRLVFFYHPFPDVYLRRPGEGGYAAWCLAKLVYYLCCAVWPAPMAIGPSGRINPFAEAPGDYLFMAALVGVIGLGYYLAARHLRGFWIWPLWIVLTVLPVLPLLATPHSGYPGAVGFAVAVVLVAAGRGAWSGRLSLWRPAVAVSLLLGSCAFVHINRLLWRGLLLGERHTLASLVRRPPPAQVTDVFFINLPFLNVYAGPSLADAWGSQGQRVRFHTLLYSPELERFSQKCRIEQLDEYRFAVRVEGRPYFSGLLGRFLLQAFRGSGRLRTGELIRGEAFDVLVTEAAGEGVSRLVFAFHEPLASTRYHFYVTTFECGAAAIKFRPPRELAEPSAEEPSPATGLEEVREASRLLAAGRADAARTLLAAVHSADPQVSRQAAEALRRVALSVARATADSVKDLLESDPLTPDGWARVGEWWSRAVDDELLEQVRFCREELADVREMRDELSRARALIARFVRSDLYLTGPPFPGPR